MLVRFDGSITFGKNRWPPHGLLRVTALGGKVPSGRSSSFYLVDRWSFQNKAAAGRLLHEAQEFFLRST